MNQIMREPLVFVESSKGSRLKHCYVVKNRKKQDSIFLGINLSTIFNQDISKEQNMILSFYCSL